MRSLLLLILACALACQDRRPAPRELQISPEVGRDDRETPVTITGRFIAAIPEIDRREVTRVRGLRLRLGGAELDATVAEKNSLRAVVPANLAPGPQRLELIDPYDQTAVIDGAFCVLGPAAQVASLEVAAPADAVAGDTFSLSLTARDAEGAVVDRFDGHAILSGALDAIVGPFSGGTWTGTIAATNPGSVSIEAAVDRSKDPAASCTQPGTGAASIAVAPGLPPRLAFAAIPAQASAGACAGPIRIETFDGLGQPLAVAAETTVAISAAPSGRFSFYADAGCTSATGSIVVPAGATAAQVWFRGEVAADYTVLVSASGFVPAAGSLAIEPAAADRFEILSPPQAVVGGACSNEVRVGLRERFGNPSPALADLDATLGADPAGGAQLVADAACSIAFNALPFAAGQSERSFWFVAGIGSSVTIGVRAPPLMPAKQTQTILPASSELRFVTPARAIASGTCSAVLTVRTTDSLGNPTPVAANTTVSLAASGAPADFRLYSDPFCSAGNAINQIVIQAGQQQANFHFSGTSAASVQLTASAPGLTSAMQNATVLATTCGNGVIVAPEQCDDDNLTNGDGCSSTCTLEAGFVCARSPSRCFAANLTYVVDDDTCPLIGSGTDADPFCAIGTALGTRPNIIIRSGNYDETLALVRNVRIVAEEGSVLGSSAVAPTILIGMVATVEIVGLQVQSLNAAAIRVGESAIATLRELTIGPAAGAGILVTDDAHATVHRSWISGCFDGISLDTTGGFDVRNDIIVQNADDGIEVLTVPPIAVISNVTLADNGDSGLDCNASPLTVTNSILWNNTNSDLQASCTAEYSDFAAGAPSATNLSADPQFTADGTYHLLATSPCIDGASGVQSSGDDFDGDARPLGAGFDMGADEAR
jgi:cysteine-rich repeat protein